MSKPIGEITEELIALRDKSKSAATKEILADACNYLDLLERILRNQRVVGRDGDEDIMQAEYRLRRE